MTKRDKSMDDILGPLQERAKELNCLYRVDEALSRPTGTLATICAELIEVIPPGWQYPDICRARVIVGDAVYERPGFKETPWGQKADIVVLGRRAGETAVYYTGEKPLADEGPFLKEERRLIDAIADRIGLYLMQHELREARDAWENAVSNISGTKRADSYVILDFLRRTEPKVLARFTRKMIHELCWLGVPGAQLLLQDFLSETRIEATDENRPQQKGRLGDAKGLTEKTFHLASQQFSEDELVGYLQTWLEEEKSLYLIQALEKPERGLSQIVEAVSRFESTGVVESDLSVAVQKSIRVALLSRLFSDQLSFLKAAEDVVRVEDFFDIVRHIIFSAHSFGKLGGKSAGIFLAMQALKRSPEHAELFDNLRVPRTWHLSSDTLLSFMHYNDLEDLYNRKYVEVDRVRQEYPHIVQVFKNCRFPPEIVAGLSNALDDFDEGRPIIVRSSSLLEDRTGSAFSGKYKSLFLANQGAKRERLEALLDAIAEVYASVFGPDPIEYRREKGLLDVHEEMGILIQEVVGEKVGRYFFPAFSGVAFSTNEFRWSGRIRREDGLARIVVGLGTRAVDRLADDYPVLISPGQPDLRVNITPDEIVRYSPKKMDVINLERNAFETIEVETLLRECKEDYPLVRKIASIVDQERVRPLTALEPDWAKDKLIVTFDQMIIDKRFVVQLNALLGVLREKLGMPVDIEFAHDGQHCYLLQCRSQSYGENHAPAPIPRDLPRDKIIFSANRYVSNGRVPDITHVVYVDPDGYAALSDHNHLKDVARAVGRLNKMLPKRQFILLGPGRWGSRGDIKLGVQVTYSDINNTAVLLEIARTRGSYLPEPSFGTHFFQDLVESGIRYIPLYPDERGVVFNELFLRRSENILAKILPEFAHLTDTVRVIDVPKETNGDVVCILLNADLDEAVGLLTSPTKAKSGVLRRSFAVEASSEEHWRWRYRMAERIAARLDSKRFGVKALYVFGSAKNSTAGPNSDLDLIIHFDGTRRQREALALWLDGWSRSLAEINYLRTGYRSSGLLDVHWVTDEDIAKKTSYAVKIGAVTDAARPLILGVAAEEK